jgi:hypothetical protein
VRHEAYGLTIETDVAFPGPQVLATDGDAPDLLIARDSGFVVPDSRGERFRRIVSEDGSETLLWANLFAFRISARGDHVSYVTLPKSTTAAFETYLSSQVMAFVLLKRDIEPLHATALEISGDTFALMGQPGAGKSTLAAACIAKGARLLTDDLFVTQRSGDGGFVVLPGLPRLKLMPDALASIPLELSSLGTMNPFTSKIVIVLPPELFQSQPSRLSRMYLLQEGSADVRVQNTDERTAFVELSENTFNTFVRSPDRRERHFTSVTALAAEVPVSRVTYARGFGNLSSVCDAILDPIRA